MQVAAGGEEKQSTALQAIGMALLGEGKDDFNSAKTWDAWKSGWDKEVKTAEDELKGFDDLHQPNGDKAELERVANLAVIGEEALENLRGKLDSLRTKVTEIKTKVEESTARIAKIEEKLIKTTVTDDLYARAGERLTQHQAATVQLGIINTRLEEDHKNLRRSKGELENLRRVLARRGKITKGLQILARTRDVFHWGALPKLVAQGNLVNMEYDINKCLEMFGNPFWADADENMGFNVHFPGAPPHRAEMLSGGQMGIFAIAFRTAVNALFGVDIGMMFLDEPTAGLDEQNVAYFHTALTKLALEVRGKRQLAIITHANDLRTAFDQVIEIGCAA